MFVSSGCIFHQVCSHCTVEFRYVKLGLLEISVKSNFFLKSRFKLSAFQLNLLLLAQISMCQNFGFLEFDIYITPLNCFIFF